MGLSSGFCWVWWYASALSKHRRRGIFVAPITNSISSPIGAAYSEDVAPDGAWEFFRPGFLQVCRAYGAENVWLPRRKPYSLHSPVCKYGLSFSLSVSRPCFLNTAFPITRTAFHVHHRQNPNLVRPLDINHRVGKDI